MYCVRDYIINGFDIKLSIAVDYTVSLCSYVFIVCYHDITWNVSVYVTPWYIYVTLYNVQKRCYMMCSHIILFSHRINTCTVVVCFLYVRRKLKHCHIMASGIGSHLSDGKIHL